MLLNLLPTEGSGPAARSRRLVPLRRSRRHGQSLDKGSSAGKNRRSQGGWAETLDETQAGAPTARMSPSEPDRCEVPSTTLAPELPSCIRLRDRREPIGFIPAWQMLVRIIVTRGASPARPPAPARSVNRPDPDIAPGRVLERAQRPLRRIARGHSATAPLPVPGGPVGPPGTFHASGARKPRLGCGGAPRARPVAILARAGGVDHARDVA